jgi:hypothetical protein
MRQVSYERATGILTSRRVVRIHPGAPCPHSSKEEQLSLKQFVRCQDSLGARDLYESIN